MRKGGAGVPAESGGSDTRLPSAVQQTSPSLSILGTCVGVIPQVAAVTPMSTEWGYEAHNGPRFWSDSCPTAACGKRQSPIDIPTRDAVIDEDLEMQPLSWFYSLQSCKALLNTGAGWKVAADGDSASVLEGGPLRQRYQLIQFHAHWGRNDNCGSEHTVDGKAYAAEVHLVHWNCDAYSRFEDAACAPDGLAVLGIFLEVGQENAELAKLLNKINKIRHKGKTCSLDEVVNPAAFIPENRSYWTYEGSLTTPPCSESVTWIVFKQPLQLSPEQLKDFRDLQFYGEECECPSGEFCGKILENYRPPQPIAGRVVREASK